MECRMDAISRRRTSASSLAGFQVGAVDLDRVRIAVLAARLSQAGYDVAVVARGPHLQAILKDGLRKIIDPTQSDVPERARLGR